MFSSLLQALAVDSTFFVQFFIFLAIYPVLSRLLFRPYFQLENQRERETRFRMQKAEELKKKKEDLRREYEQKAHDIKEGFNKLYNQKSKELRKSFLKVKTQNQKEIQKEHEQKNKVLFQEIKEAEAQLQAEIEPLTRTAVECLIS